MLQSIKKFFVAVGGTIIILALMVLLLTVTIVSFLLTHMFAQI